MSLDTFINPDSIKIVGPLIITSDNNSGAAGKISSDNGTFLTDGAGNITAASLTNNGAFNASVSATSPAPVTPLASGSMVMRFTPTGAVVALDIAAGTKNGQIVIIENNTTVVTDTMTISGSHVLLDASSDGIVVKAASCEMFVFDLALNSGAGLWVHVGPFGG